MPPRSSKPSASAIAANNHKKRTNSQEEASSAESAANCVDCDSQPNKNFSACAPCAIFKLYAENRMNVVVAIRTLLQNNERYNPPDHSSETFVMHEMIESLPNDPRVCSMCDADNLSSIHKCVLCHKVLHMDCSRRVKDDAFNHMGVCSACESRFKDLVVATCGPDLTSPLRVLSLLQVLLADTSKLPDQIAKLVPNLVIRTEAEPEVPKRQKIDFGPHRSILQCFIDAGVRSADSKAVEKIANALGIPTINLKTWFYRNQGEVESVVPVGVVEGHEKEPNLDVRVLKRTRVTSARDQIAADDSNDPIDATHWTGMQKIRWRLANATNDQWNKAEDKAAVLRGDKPIPEYLSPAELSKIQDYRLQRLYDEAKACRDVEIDIILSTMCCDKVKHVNYGKHAEVLNRLYYTNAGFTWGAQWIGAKARLHRDEAVQRTEVVANQNQKELQNQVNRLLMDLLENAYQKEFPDKPLPTKVFPYKAFGSSKYPFKLCNWPSDIPLHSAGRLGRFQCQTVLKAGVTMVKHRGLQRVENLTDPNEALIHDTLVETNNGISLLASAATAIPSEIVPITAPAAERVPQLNRTQEDNIDKNNAIWRCDVQKNEAVLVLAGGRYHGTGSKRRYVEEHVPGIVQSYNPHLKQFTVHTPHNCKTDANVPRNKILTSRDPVFGQAEIADIMKDSAETEVYEY